MRENIMIFGHDKDPANYPGRFKSSVFMQEGFNLETMKEEIKYTLVTDDDGLMDKFFLCCIANKTSWLCSCQLNNEGVYLYDWKKEMGL